MTMRHVWTVSRVRPAGAQLEEIASIIDIIQRVIGILSDSIRLGEQLERFLGRDLFSKAGDTE